MAIAFDSSVDGGDNGGTTNSHTFAFNNVAGSILFVGFCGHNLIGTDDITGVTYNAVALAFVGKIFDSVAPIRWLYLYVLQNPATGSNNVVINCTSNHRLSAGAVSYSGADLTGQPDANTTNAPGGNVSTLTTPLTSIADNCWHMLVANGFDASSPPGAGAGTTRRVFEASFGQWGLFDSNSAKTPAGSVSLTTTYPTAANAITHVMASFAPSVTVASPSLPMGAYQALKRGAFF